MWDSLRRANERVSVCIGYDDYQFSGIVRRLRVNGQSVKLSDLPIDGMAEVVPCSAGPVEDFIEHMKQQKQEHFHTHGHGRS